MFCFKTLRQLHEWFAVKPLLREIVEDCYDHSWPSNVNFVITDIARTPTENAEAGARTTIHVTPEGEEHRAVDARAWQAAPVDASRAVEYVNRKWEYDASRPTLPVAYLHDAGSRLHIHFQLSASTKPRSS